MFRHPIRWAVVASIAGFTRQALIRRIRPSQTDNGINGFIRALIASWTWCARYLSSQGVEPIRTNRFYNMQSVLKHDKKCFKKYKEFEIIIGNKHGMGENWRTC